MRILLAALVALLFSMPACAQTTASQGDAEAMAQRDTWQQGLVVLREGMAVQVERKGLPTRSHWVAWERTPNKHLRILVKDTPEAEKELTILVQDKRTMALMGDDVTAPAAPWMMGHQLFGEALEPIMLVNWTLGLPGQSFSVSAEPASIAFENGLPKTLVQDGWTVTFEEWAQASGPTPPLPQQLRACKNDTCLSITMAALQGYTALPEGYNEFRIM